MRKLKPGLARLARAFDLALAPFALLRRAPAPIAPDAPHRVLVLEVWQLGDLVLATPALQALRAALPRARITLLAAPAARELLLHQDLVDEVLPFEAPWVRHGLALHRWDWPGLVRTIGGLRGRFDVAIDFRGDLRDNLLLWATGSRARAGLGFAGGGALLTHEARARPDRHQAEQALDVVAALGLPTGAPRARLCVSREEDAAAARLLAAAGVAGPFATLHPGARWEGRRWPAERFAALAGELARDGLAVVLVGGPEDAPLLDAIAAASPAPLARVQPRLRELVALVARARLCVGIDSGPMHVAAAVGTPVVGLFGPQRPEWFGPYGGPSRVVREPVPCHPCDQIACHRPADSCMQRLAVETVAAAARALLAETAPRA